MKKTYFAFLIFPGFLCGNPTLPTVVTGEARFDAVDASTLHIHTGDRAIINWHDFSIHAQETTRFIQPSSHSAVLNRVMGGNPSQLMGHLEANGAIFLINPNGILVGKGARIDTARFVASTLDVLDASFLREQELLFQGETQSSIINLGVINAWDGDVVLIGCHIDNQGTLNAPRGGARLATGHEILLKPDGVEKIFIRPQGKAIGIDHSGEMSVLEAEIKADGNPYSMGIQMKGQIDALGLNEQGGRIYLVAEGGSVEVDGALTVGPGEIRILGESVSILDHARIDASSPNSGGRVLIGGDFQGKNPEILNAKQTHVSRDAYITVSALEEGDGGEVFIWSDGCTGMYGKIDARGGALSGDGGFVEVSGKTQLDFHGLVDRGAPFGKMGTLLLDPSNVNITTQPNNNIAFGGGCGPGTYCTVAATPTPSNIQIADIITNLALGPVTISTDSSFEDRGDIVFNGTLNYNSDNDLTFLATRDITFMGNSVSNTSGSLGGITLIAGRDITLFDNSSGAPVFLFTGNGIINITAGSFSGIAEVSVPRVGNLTLQSGVTSNAQILSDNGDIAITVGNDVRLISSGGTNFNTRIAINNLGTLSISAGHDVVLQAGDSTNARASIGTTGTAPVVLTASHEILLQGGSGAGSSSDAAITTVSGNMTLTAGNGGLHLLGGTAQGNIAQVLSGGITTITSSGNLVLQGGSGLDAFAEMRTGSQATTITANSDMQLLAGTGGSARIYSTHQSPVSPPTITISVDKDLILDGNIGSGNAKYTFAQIGSDPSVVLSPHSHIRFTKIGRDLQLLGNTTAQTPAAPSPPSPAPPPSPVSYFGYAMIGHGGVNDVSDSGNTRFGNITLDGAGVNSAIGRNLVMQGGGASGDNANIYSFAQIGHTGSFNGTQLVSGNVVIVNSNSSLASINGSLNMSGGTGSSVGYALIGHGGIANSGQNTFGAASNTTVNVLATDMKIMGGIGAGTSNFSGIGCANQLLGAGTVVFKADLVQTNSVNATTVQAGSNAPAFLGFFSSVTPNAGSVFTALNTTTGTDLFINGATTANSAADAFVGIEVPGANANLATTQTVSTGRNLFLTGGSSGSSTSRARIHNGELLVGVGGGLTMTVRRDLRIIAGTKGDALIDITGPVQATITQSGSASTTAITPNNLDMTANGSFDAQLTSTDSSLTLLVGKDITLTGFSGVTTKQATISAFSGDCNYVANRSMALNNNSQMKHLAGSGILTVRAGENMIMQGNASMSTTNPSSTGRLDVVIDQQSPASVGPSLFAMGPSNSLSTAAGLLRIFTVRPSRTSIDSAALLNGNLGSTVPSNLMSPFFYNTTPSTTGTPFPGYTLFLKTNP